MTMTMAEDTQRGGAPAFDPGATGRRVRLARERLGWSQRQLATHAELSLITVKRIERGDKRGMTLYSFTQVYLALNTTPNALLGVGDAPGSQSDTTSLV